MTLSDLRTARQQAEQAIQRVLLDFMTDTGVRVSSVAIEVKPLSGAPVDVVVGVRLHLDV